jgi:lipopolysaccharide heptosyltransferase I
MSTRILAIRLGSLGDIIHTLPAVATLRGNFPGVHIDWLVEERWRDLLELNPDLNGVVTVDTYSWRRTFFLPTAWLGAAQALLKLRRGAYDVAIDFQGLYKSALLARLSGAEWRIGFDVKAIKEAGAARFYTEQIPVFGRKSHIVQQYLSLGVAACGGRGTVAPILRFPLPTKPEDDEYVEQQLRAEQASDFFIVSPGGGWGAKCWPVERYAQLSDALAKQYGWRAYVNTGPGEDKLLAGFTAQVQGAKPLHFKLKTRQLVALVKRAKLVISGDTGPLHIAAAVGTPVVGLYGPTDPARNGPYAKHAVVVHHPDAGPVTYKRNDQPAPGMLAITVEEALAAVASCLEKKGG